MNSRPHIFIDTHLPEAGLATLGYGIEYVSPEDHDFKVEIGPYIKANGKRDRRYDQAVASSASRNWRDDSHLYPRKSAGVEALEAWRVSHNETGATVGHILIARAPNGGMWNSADFVAEPVIADGTELEGVHPWHAGAHMASGPCDLKTAHFFTSFFDDFMQSWGAVHGRPDFASLNKARTSARIEAEQKVRFQQRQGIKKQIERFLKLLADA